MTPAIPPRFEIVLSGLVMTPAVCMNLAVLAQEGYSTAISTTTLES